MENLKNQLFVIFFHGGFKMSKSQSVFLSEKEKNIQRSSTFFV